MLSSDMEYFDGSSWRSISAYPTNGYVLQYEYKDGIAKSVLVKPSFYCKSKGDVYKIGNNDFGCLSLEVTGDTNLVYFDGDSLGKLDLEQCLMFDKLQKGSNSGSPRLLDSIPVVFPMEDCDLFVHLSDDEIMHIVYLLNTDGTGNFIQKYKDYKLGSYLSDAIYRIDFDSRKRLLSALGMHFVDNFLIMVKNLKLASTLCTLWNTTYSSKLHFIEDLSIGDGDVNLPALTNVGDLSDVGSMKCGYREDTGFGNWYGVSVEKDVDCYKLDVPSGMLVVRKGGSVPIIPFVVGC